VVCEVDRYSRRSFFKAAVRSLKWLHSWAASVLGPEAPAAKALASCHRLMEDGLAKEGS
jgi:hypothetical protein